MEYFVTLSCHSETEAGVARAVEVMSRAAAGLAMEGVSVFINVGQLDPEDD